MLDFLTKAGVCVCVCVYTCIHCIFYMVFKDTITRGIICRGGLLQTSLHFGGGCLKMDSSIKFLHNFTHKINL
jgi:hypothetical protein